MTQQAYSGALDAPAITEIPWGRNFIDHRHSRVMVDNRNCPACPDCGCELDRGDSVHSPRCPS